MCQTHPDLRRKLAALLLGVAEQFDVASNISVMQVWLPDAADGAGAATNNAAMQLRADGFDHYRCDRNMSMGECVSVARRRDRARFPREGRHTPTPPIARARTHPKKTPTRAQA